MESPLARKARKVHRPDQSPPEFAGEDEAPHEACQKVTAASDLRKEVRGPEEAHITAPAPEPRATSHTHKL